MGTRTYTYNNQDSQIIRLVDNGLGEIIKIRNNTLSDTHKNYILKDNNTVDDDGYSINITVNACDYYDVYFKPVNGSKIEKFRNVQLSSTFKSYYDSDGDKDSQSWEDDEGLEDLNQENNYIYPDITFKNYETNEVDYEFDGSGCIYLGQEHSVEYVETRTNSYSDWDDYSYTSYDSSEITYKNTAIGEANYVDVNVIGNQDSNKFMYYTRCNSDGDEFTNVFRTASNDQTYTNIIAFDDKYDFNGTDIPPHFAQCSTKLQVTPSISWYSSEEYLAFTVFSRRTYTLTGSNTGKIFQNSYKVEHSIEHKIKSILIYVDCAFAVFTPSWYSPGLDMPQHYLYSTFKDSEYYEESYIKQNGIRLQHIPCYDLLMRSKNSDKYLYLSYQYFLINLSPDGLPKMETRVSNPFETNIPKEHRWVQLLGMGGYDRVTGYNAIVRLVDKNTRELIKDIVVVEDGYVRYTEYWYVKTYSSENDFVVGELADVPYTWNNKIENRVYYPIVKPWASVHMNVFPEQKKNEPFGKKREKNWTYKTVKSKLNSNFTKIYFPFYREITIDADKEFDDVHEKIKEYGRTLSPFRVETFTCHGCRIEYDKDSRELNGRDSIAMSKQRNFKRTDWDKIHDIVDQYNESIFSNNNMYWNVFVESCFGQGIKTEQTRGSDITSNFINSTFDILPGRANAFVTIGAVGTHCDYGNRTGWGVGSSIMCKFMSDTITYYELSDNFNNFVKNCKEQTFKIIRNFYNNNFSEMLFCLKDEITKLEWLETKDLINEDLYNQGRRYFIQYDWNKTLDDGNPHPCYNASDNYFNIPEREYRINDGFIGLIKDAMCVSMTNNDDKWGCFKKFDNPQGGLEFLYKDMVDRCKNNIKQCGKNIQTLYKNSLSSSYYCWLASISSIIEPRMFVYGKLKNAKFLDYPEEEAEMKKWLTSDDDLNNLVEATTE